MAQIGNHTNLPIEEDLVRHMVLNKIRQIRKKFSDCGEIVIACDGRNTWRRQMFQYYKANRKIDRSKSDFDWHAIYEILNKIKDELRDNFPYIVIHVEGAEADDVIASLVNKYGVEINTDTSDKIVIVSGDKDFVQLQRFANVEQYDPIKSRSIVENDPYKFVKMHIIKGDRGDGIPNILSDDNCLVSGVRQKKITEKFIDNFNYDQQPEQIQRNYMRNFSLIDLSQVPITIQLQSLATYDVEKKTSPARKQKMFNYFVNKRLKNLMECIGEF